jgi:hypothetical protein
MIRKETLMSRMTVELAPASFTARLMTKLSVSSIRIAPVAITIASIASAKIESTPSESTKLR